MTQAQVSMENHLHNSHYQGQLFEPMYAYEQSQVNVQKLMAEIVRIKKDWVKEREHVYQVIIGLKEKLACQDRARDSSVRLLSAQLAITENDCAVQKGLLRDAIVLARGYERQLVAIRESEVSYKIPKTNTSTDSDSVEIPLSLDNMTRMVPYKKPLAWPKPGESDKAYDARLNELARQQLPKVNAQIKEAQRSRQSKRLKGNVKN